MLRNRFLLVVATFFLLVNARQRAVQHPTGWPLTNPPADQFTFSRPAEVTTRHLSLDLTVDFENRRLSGTAMLDIENLTGTRTLVLDTHQLNVTSVTLDGGTATTYSFGAATGNGRPLNITIEPTTDTVTIAYSTSATAPALYWNTAEQSYGRVQPYLYSLNEPIAARSWIPIQDTPTMRLTYDATLRVPRGLLALMSANDNPRVANDTGVYRFNMNYRIPVYLVALAVGRLEFAPIDERTGVYAEPELLEDAAWALQYLDEMVDVAEGIAGPFPYERHDVLFMPPTFVVGGMEHPMLNFVDPATVTRNHPPVPLPSTLIAHELAHSWAGNSATLASWNDVWINEGITSYLTHRIIEVMSGPERAELNWFNDRRNYAGYVQGGATDTVLHTHVQSAGAGFDSTSYVKGALFIRTLEDHIGRAQFDFFLRRYFQIFAFRWVDDQNFLTLLRELTLTGKPQLEQQLRLNEWLYSPGLPSNLTAPTSSVLLTRVQQRAAQFSAGTPIAQLSPATWTQVELDQFLLAAPEAIRSRMSEVDAAFSLSTRVTPPLTWLTHALTARYEPAMPAVERALMRGGPGSWITRLYTGLVNAGYRSRALEIFNRARKRYRADIEAQVLQILDLTSATSRKAA